MSTSITPAPGYSSTSVVSPDNGDDLDADVVTAALQMLVDRDSYLWSVVNALFGYCGEVEITSSNLVLPALGVSLSSGGTWKVYATGGGTVSLSPLAAVSDAWRYAYLYVNSGALAVEFSADPPDDTRTWKSTGVLTHRYLAPIRMSSVAGAAVPLRGRTGRWAYGAQGGALASVTSSGEVSLAGRVPPHVRRATVRARAARLGSTGTLAAAVQNSGATGYADDAFRVDLPSIPDTQGVSGSGDVVLSASQQVSVEVGADCLLALSVATFTE